MRRFDWEIVLCGSLAAMSLASVALSPISRPRSVGESYTGGRRAVAHVVGDNLDVVTVPARQMDGWPRNSTHVVPRSMPIDGGLTLHGVRWLLRFVGRDLAFLPE